MNIHEYGYEIVRRFKTLYPELVREMKASDHNGINFDSSWHMEGDVWTHTMMVISQIYTEFENRADIPSFKRLFIAALLHDIGKPLARAVKDNDHVNFYGHDGISTFLAHNKIYELDNTLTSADKIYILQLINYHQVLFGITDKSSHKAIAKLADKFMGRYGLLDDVITLRHADYMGNISIADNNISYSKIQELRDIVNVWHSDEVIVGVPFINILVGLPCSGKDTYLQHEWHNPKVISRDDILMSYANGMSYSEAFATVDQKLVDSEFRATFERYIKEGESFFVNRTNLTHKGRMKFINRAKQAGFKIKVTVLMSSLDEIDKRNQNRVGKIIPNHVFTNMMKSFDMPFADEGEVIYHFNYSIGETNV